MPFREWREKEKSTRTHPADDVRDDHPDVTWCRRLRGAVLPILQGDLVWQVDAGNVAGSGHRADRPAGRDRSASNAG